MKKTTLYIPDDLKKDIALEAARTARSEADLIRSVLRDGVPGSRPRPRGGIVRGGEPMADRVDELLAGFGES